MAWKKCDGTGDHGEHHALHVEIEGLSEYYWRLYDLGDRWRTTFGWKHDDSEVGKPRRTIEEAKAAVEVAAKALGHKEID